MSLLFDPLSYQSLPVPRFVGDICRITEEMIVKWLIPQFFSFSDSTDVSYASPSFQFLGESWYLTINLNGERKFSSKKKIAVFLTREHNSSPVAVACSIGLMTADGKKYNESSFTYDFDKKRYYGIHCIAKWTEVFEKKKILVPSGALTILCSVKKHVPSLFLRTEELSRDLKFLLNDESNSDVTVRVEGKEFRLHRSILGARSPVLAAMFKHETEEKITGVVSIKDCSADVFRSFTNYLYTGKMNGLSVDNVFDLFHVADKYQVKELASDCIDYIKDTLTVNTFCSAAEVALNHGYQSLLEPVIDLLWAKMGEIIKMEQWKMFLLKNPLRANELLEKAFDSSRK